MKQIQSNMSKSEQFEFLRDLILSHQNRNKVFSWSELKNLTGLNPSQIIQLLAEEGVGSPVDPSWTFSQSGKNQNRQWIDKILQYYTNPEVFALQPNTYGLSTRLGQATNNPIWFNLIKQNDWFWKQKQALKLAAKLKCLPGIKAIYLVGSTSLHISGPNSDIDLAVVTRPQVVLPVRMLLKIWLKLLGLDVFPFHLGLYLQLLKLGRGLGFGPNKFYETKIGQVEEQIWQFKQAKVLKLDLGIITDRPNLLAEKIGQEPRLLSLWGAKRIDVMDNLTLFANEQYLLEYQKNDWIDRVGSGITILLTPLVYLLWPLSLWQLVWHKLVANPLNPYIFTYHLVCFYPLHTIPNRE
jgi:predicted nucleotidyltransferase